VCVSLFLYEFVCIVKSSQSQSIKDSNDDGGDDDGKWQCLIYYLLQREWKAEGKVE